MHLVLIVVHMNLGLHLILTVVTFIWMILLVLSLVTIGSWGESADFSQLLPFNYGGEPTDCGLWECLPAIKVHSKDLDNDGEITTKLSLPSLPMILLLM